MSKTPKVVGHSDGVESVVFSPDGCTLASGSWDKTVKLWDVQTGELKRTLTGHSNQIKDVVYSPDGRMLASTGDDRTIILWDANTGERKNTLTGHFGHIWHIIYSPDGNTLASASSDKTLNLWDANTGELKHTLKGHSKAVKVVAFSDDGKRLVSASDDEVIKLWEASTGELKNTFTGHSGWVRHLVSSPDGNIWVLSSEHSLLKLWCANTGELKKTFSGHFGLIKHVAYSPDGKRLASCSENRRIYLYDVKTGEQKKSLSYHTDKVRDVAYSPDGKTLASASEDHTVNLWDAHTGELKHTLASADRLVDKKSRRQESTRSADAAMTRGITMGVAGTPSRDADMDFMSADVDDGLSLDLDEDDGLSDMAEERKGSAHRMHVEHFSSTLSVNAKPKLKAEPSLSARSIPPAAAMSKSVSFSRHRSPSQNVPVTSQTQPLPHNGLFIRRNSAFGTKLSTSLKDIIAQGVRVEQQHIRFDDFVAMKTEGIPSPTANHALAVSHGIAEIPAYQQRNNRATHYLEIALKTADAASAGHLETQAPPVNYIFVVDVSGSMSGEKIDTVKAAIRELFMLLRADDVIGVIAFDHQVKTLLESTPKQNLSADDFGQVINRLTVGGMTDINLALSISIDEMRRYRGAQRVNQLFLFSDGDPTAGETNWINIRQNIAAKLRKNTATDGNIRLSTFVFGTDANKVELDKLAGITGGQSTLVIEPAEDVRDSLQQELSRRTHLAAINVQMQIEIDPDIEIMHFYGHTLITDRTVRAAVEREADLTGKQVEKDYGVKAQPDLIKEDQGIRVFVPNLAKDETYWVVFELAVPALRQSTDFGKATVQYFDTFARQNEKHPFDLATTGPITPQWVAQHALGLWTSEVASYALYDVEAQDLATAEKRIQAHISILEAARTQLTSTLDASSAALVDDIITLNKFLSLAENLNKETTGGTEASNYLNYGLSELDRVRNGFVCRECA